jgi:hypothetical protein
LPVKSPTREPPCGEPKVRGSRAIVTKLRRGSAFISKRQKYWLYNKPFSTLLPLPPASSGSALRWLPAPPLIFSKVYKFLAPEQAQPVLGTLLALSSITLTSIFSLGADLPQTRPANRVTLQKPAPSTRESIPYTQEFTPFTQENILFSQEFALFSWEFISFSRENILFTQEFTLFSQENILFTQEFTPFSQEFTPLRGEIFVLPRVRIVSA